MDELKFMQPILVHFSNGKQIRTRINGTRCDVRRYYLGQLFNFGDTPEHPQDDVATAVQVDFLD